MSDTNEVQDGYENNLSDDSKSSIIASNDHSSFNPESPRSNFGYLLNPMLEAASLASRETQATGAPIINNSPSSTKFDPHDGKSDLNRNAGSIRGLLNTSLKNSSDSIHGARQAFFARSLDFGSELSNGGLSEINNDPKDFPPGRPPSPVSEITPTVAKEFSVDFYPTEKESYPRLPSISTLLGKFLSTNFLLT